MLNPQQHQQAMMVLAGFYSAGWMYWSGSKQGQCFPVSQFMLPTLVQFNDRARVYVGYHGDVTDRVRMEQAIRSFMKSPCSFKTPPPYHAWIADSGDQSLLADYTLCFGTGVDCYTEQNKPSGKDYVSILTMPVDVADFAAALLAHNMCGHPARKMKP